MSGRKKAPIGAVPTPKKYEKAYEFIDGKPVAKLPPEAFKGLTQDPVKTFMEMDAKVPPQAYEDPWAHRSRGMRCRSCMWYVGKNNTGPIDPVKGPIGRCRRHAPTMNGYPAVYITDWCGDHKLDENKGE